MMSPRSGISERQWILPSICWSASNFSPEKALPDRERQTQPPLVEKRFRPPYFDYSEDRNMWKQRI